MVPAVGFKGAKDPHRHHRRGGFDHRQPNARTRRLQLAIDTAINSPDARAEGFGQVNPGRLSLMASQVSDAFATKSRVNPDVLWNAAYLPSAKELDVLPKK